MANILDICFDKGEFMAILKRRSYEEMPRYCRWARHNSGRTCYSIKNPVNAQVVLIENRKEETSINKLRLDDTRVDKKYV